MLAAMLFAISIVALTQFAAYYWRAMLAGAAAQPISERVLAAAGAQNGRLTGEDFPALVGIHELTPELRPGGNGLSLVRVYYRLVDAVASLVGSSYRAFPEAQAQKAFGSVNPSRWWPADHTGWRGSLHLADAKHTATRQKLMW